MRLIDHSFDEPENNLALDEVLLDAVDAGSVDSTLRLWESPRPFVVLGTAQCLAAEVHESACTAAGVPVLRRCSAGGCVLQGPGCLNYSLALRYDHHPDLKNLHASYTWILGQLVAALGEHGIPAELSGISDLSCGGKKFSGNAQRRRRNALLHHGTILYRVDFDLMARLLQEPADRPEYRGTRDHQAFVAPVSLDSGSLRSLICRAFEVEACEIHTLGREELATTKQLATEKYLDPAWIRRR